MTSIVELDLDTAKMNQGAKYLYVKKHLVSK